MEQISTTEFDSQVLRPLRRLGWFLRWRVLVAGATRSAAIALLLMSVDLALDMLLSLGVGPRAALLCLMVGIVGRQAWLHVLQPLRMRPGPLDLAGIVERRFPILRDRLVSAVAFAGAGSLRPERDSPALVAALMRDARESYSLINSTDVLDHLRHRRFMVIAGAILIIVAGFGSLAPEVVATYVARDMLLRDVPWPSRTRISVEGMVNGRMRRPLGDELTLVALAEGEIPRGLAAEVQYPDGRVVARDTVRRGDRQFLVEYGPLDQSLRIRFLIWKFGVDERSGWFDVEAVERPGVRHATMTITPPAYAAKPAYTLPQDQATATLLRGGRVQITAEPTKPVVRASLRDLSGSTIPAAITSDGRVVSEFVPAVSGTYSFDLLDASGLGDLRPRGFVLRVEADPPPRVRLSLPGVGEMIVPAAVPRLVVECEDNLGVRSLELQHRVIVAGSEAGIAATPQREAWPGFDPGASQYRDTREWPLAPLGLKPGDQLSLSVRAADDQGGSLATSSPAEASAGVAESTTFMLRVVTPEELLNELARRESEWRRELEHILKSQEQIGRRVHELHDQASRGGLSGERRAEYDAQERAQRGQTGRLRAVRQQYQRILDELKVNQLADPAVRRRMEDGVIGPLGKLSGTDCVAAADLMQRVRAQYQPETADEVEQAQSRIVEQMYAILAQMLKWEGYNEAVALMRDILRLQEDVNRQTKARLDRQVEGLFGPGATSQPRERQAPAEPRRP